MGRDVTAAPTRSRDPPLYKCAAAPAPLTRSRDQTPDVPGRRPEAVNPIRDGGATPPHAMMQRPTCGESELAERIWRGVWMGWGMDHVA